jgi:hypothetical protein
MADFGHREKALNSVDKRERHSLETEIRRNAFRLAVAGREMPAASPQTRERKAASPAQDAERQYPALTPSQRALLEKFRRSAKAVTKPETRDRASGDPADDLRAAIRRADELRKGKGKGTPKKPEGSLSDTFDKAATPGKTEEREQEERLTESFRKAQEQRKKKEQR